MLQVAVRNPKRRNRDATVRGRAGERRGLDLLTHGRPDGVRPPTAGRLHPAPRFVRGTLACLLCGVALAGCAPIDKWLATYHVERGESLMRADDLETALAEFREAAQLDPQLAVAHSNMGVIYRRMGDYEQAIECFVNAIRFDPFDFADTLNLAQLYHFTQRLRDAVQAYLHAVELRPDHFEAQLNLGVCYQQLGDHTQAVYYFQRAIELDVNRPHAYANLGVALDSQGKHYEAVRAYKEALERDSRQPLVLVNLAQAYMKQNRLKMARQALTQAIRMDGDLAAASEAMGYCLFQMRDFKEAATFYRRALVCEPHLPRAHAGLGSISMLLFREDKTQTGYRDQALEHWHRSLELDPDQPRIRKLIAKYHPKQGDPEETLLNGRAPR